MGKVTQETAQFILSTSFENIPEETVDYSKKLALSYLGAALAGSTLATGKKITVYVKAKGGIPEASLAGIGFKALVEDVALANGSFAHATELEDDSLPEACYAWNVWPVVFALGEKLKVSGKKIIEAFAIGYEVQARFALACLSAVEKGFLAAAVMGNLGSAASAAKMLNLDIKQTCMALSFNASQAMGLLRQTGTDAHLVECGFAARNGITAALLAKEGVTANPNILEDKLGFCFAVSGPGGYDLTNVVKKDEEPFRVMAIGIKKYPSCYLEQRIIDGVFDLMKEGQFSHRDVESVTVEVDPVFAEVVKYSDPATPEEGRFSVSYSIASALLDQKVSLDTYTTDKLGDPRNKEVRDKVKVIVHPEWPRGWNPVPSLLSIKLKDGRELKKTCEKAKGDPGLYLTWDEVMDKYRMCAKLALPQDKIEHVADLVSRLDKLEDITPLANAVAGL